MNSKSIGDISESFIIYKLLDLGISVSKPFGDNQRYDLIIEINRKLYTIQIKTAKFEEDFILFPTSSSAYHRGGKRKHYRGEVDFIAAFCPDNKICYLVNSFDVPTTMATLRLTEPKNGQRKGVRWAEDYELEKQIHKLFDI